MLPRIINEGCMKPFQSSLVALITFGLLPFGVAAPEATPASKLSVLNDKADNIMPAISTLASKLNAGLHLPAHRVSDAAPAQAPAATGAAVQRARLRADTCPNTLDNVATRTLSPINT